ncbi:MAG: hypothetical protein CL878_10235 [Dehalococcoidia bacterium]|nr:hypothetical protein [Dehalococcoidia bacterium]
MKFLEARGGIELFGYPISDEHQEADHYQSGRTRAVQYFERARLEYYAEHAGTRHEVQLGLLGDELLRQRGWLLD